MLEAAAHVLLQVWGSLPTPTPIEGQTPVVTPSIVFVSCRALHLELPYTDAMRHVLLLGGDTDTNAGEPHLRSWARLAGIAQAVVIKIGLEVPFGAGACTARALDLCRFIWCGEYRSAVNVSTRVTTPAPT
jgi:hypothetical protein